jgi:hypothetical protein
MFKVGFRSATQGCQVSFFVGHPISHGFSFRVTRFQQVHTHGRPGASGATNVQPCRTAKIGFSGAKPDEHPELLENALGQKECVIHGTDPPVYFIDSRH